MVLRSCSTFNPEAFCPRLNVSENVNNFTWSWLGHGTLDIFNNQFFQQFWSGKVMVASSLIYSSFLVNTAKPMKPFCILPIIKKLFPWKLLDHKLNKLFNDFDSCSYCLFTSLSGCLLNLLLFNKSSFVWKCSSKGKSYRTHLEGIYIFS